MKTMAYSAEESSPVISDPIDSCCICEEEFSSDGELTTHLINHTNEEEYKAGLLELEKKSPVKKPNQNNSYSVSNSKKEPLKRSASQRSSTPEVWEIISDDSDDESNKNSKSAKLSNSFRLVSTPNKPENSKMSVQNNIPNNKPAKVIPSYKCHSCSSEFKDVKLLQNHMLTHEKEKSFTCHICKKAFLHKTSLRQHLHLHIGDKSHQCKICNKKFTVKSVLRKHELEHQQAAMQTKTNVVRNQRQKSAG